MQQQAGSVVGIWRYPVKSMMGEELNASEVTERGLLGDRAYGLVDRSTGKVASAKNPRKWPHLFDFRAAYVDAPRRGAQLPAVRITLPDGTVLTSGQRDLDRTLSHELQREVGLEAADRRRQPGAVSGVPTPRAPEPARAEEYWPDMEGLDHRDTVTDFDMPERTFFDLATVHVLTTATLDRLRELYPQGRFEVRRFRPNIVVGTPDDVDGFAENDWIGSTLRIGDRVRLSITEACPRCVMTTLSQGDLPKDSGILRAAAQHNHANVGVYAAVVQGGEVRRGAAVMVEQPVTARV
ncbi:MOSC domain-containing protein [Geodermatophilus sp. SYSU D00703]